MQKKLWCNAVITKASANLAGSSGRGTGWRYRIRLNGSVVDEDNHQEEV